MITHRRLAGAIFERRPDNGYAEAHIPTSNKPIALRIVWIAVLLPSERNAS